MSRGAGVDGLLTEPKRRSRFAYSLLIGDKRGGEIVGRRDEKKAAKARKKELRKARRRRRRRRFILLSLLAAAVMAILSFLRRPSPGSGQVAFADENPGGLAFMVGQMLMAFLKDPSKKAIADKMNVAIAIQVPRLPGNRALTAATAPAMSR